MKILLVGVAGRLGAALSTAFTARGHSVLSAGRSTGDFAVELAEPAGDPAVYRWARKIDGAASALGVRPVTPLQEMTADYRRRWPCAGRAMVETGSADVGARHDSPLGRPVRSASTRRGGGGYHVGLHPADCREGSARSSRQRGRGCLVTKAHTTQGMGPCRQHGLSGPPLATGSQPRNVSVRRPMDARCRRTLPDHYAVLQHPLTCAAIRPGGISLPEYIHISARNSYRGINSHLRI
jgi:hypothetical protein